MTDYLIKLDTRKLWFAQCMEERTQRLYRAQQRRLHRLFWLSQIVHLQENGQIVLAMHSRDCDGCSGTSYYTLPANAKAIDAEMARCDQWAEGPTSYSLQAPSAKRPHNFRDHTLEAFEDGHAHILFV